MKMNVVADCMTAIPRKSKIGLLIFGIAFFFGESDNIGKYEITLFSKRCDGNGLRFVFFKIKRWH